MSNSFTHTSRFVARRHDELSPSQRRAMVGVIAAAHVVAGWGVLQVPEVREAVRQAAPPLFVSLITPSPAPLPVLPAAPLPPPVAPKPLPVPPPVRQPAPVAKRPAPQLVATPSTPAVTATVPDSQPAPPLPPAEPPGDSAAAPLPAAAAVPDALAPPAPAPVVIPASAVQYLEPIALEYPRLSRRLRESGRVTVQVHIDQAGLATNVQLGRSSGHPRLDDAALAAVRKARFKPYMQDGQAVAGWATIPINFELEN